MAPKHTIGVDVCVAILSYFGLEEQVHPILLDPAPELWHSLGYLIGLTWKNTSRTTTQSKIQVKFGTVHISSGQVSTKLHAVFGCKLQVPPKLVPHTSSSGRQTVSMSRCDWLTWALEPEFVQQALLQKPCLCFTHQTDIHPHKQTHII